MISEIRQWVLDKAGLDQAVIFTLLTKLWQALAGAVSLLLIAKFFSPQTQGFYYTFWSLLALQTFVELGLYVVIVNLASHEWSRLSIDAVGRVVGDPVALSRLASLARFVARWYAGVSLVFVVIAGIAGGLFLSGSAATEVSWQGPWWVVLALAGVQLWLLPLLSLLEGCNQVVALNRFRLGQTVVESAATLGLLIAGAGLWVAVGAQAARVAATLYFVIVRYGRFLRSIAEGIATQRVRWRVEIWPMQWRLALQGAVNYFMFSLFTPVMFHYHGPEVAGRMGMTLQIATLVQAMALSWVQTKVPQFGMLVAKRDYGELDRTWWRASKLSFTFASVAGLSIWCAVFVLHQFGAAFAERILPPAPTAYLLAAYGLMLISYCHSAYLRAHAREPFLFLGVTSGLLVGIFVFLLGSSYGPNGAAAGFMMVAALFVVPLSTFIWARRRSEWQRA